MNHHTLRAFRELLARGDRLGDRTSATNGIEMFSAVESMRTMRAPFAPSPHPRSREQPIDLRAERILRPRLAEHLDVSVPDAQRLEIL